MTIIRFSNQITLVKLLNTQDLEYSVNRIISIQYDRMRSGTATAEITYKSLQTQEQVTLLLSERSTDESFFFELLGLIGGAGLQEGTVRSLFVDYEHQQIRFY